jgi:hypothetical protein
MKGGRLSSIKLELSEMKSKQVTNKESGLGVLGKGLCYFSTPQYTTSP